MFPILQLGPLAIPVAPLVFLLSVFGSASLVEQHAARLGLAREIVSNMLYVGLGAALLGARLAYVANHLDAYARDPISILMPTPATLDWFGGVFIGMSAGVVYGFKHRLPLWRTLDALAPGLAAMGNGLGIAHLASGDAFGAPARLAWSIYLWDDFRHSSQAYEIVAAISIFAIWWFLRARKMFDGFQFLVVIALSAVSVIFLEAFRGDSWLFQGWRAPQLVALGVLVVSLAAMRRRSQRASEQSRTT